MNIMAAKFLCRRKPKIQNLVTYNVVKRNMTQKDSCSQSTPTSTPDQDPPPCPPMPNCPPSICPPVKDPNHPCNYCPPPCVDPDAPDITRLKRIQCKLQTNPDAPVYLKIGSIDAILFQGTVILTGVGLAISLYELFKIIKS